MLHCFIFVVNVSCNLLADNALKSFKKEYFTSYRFNKNEVLQ